MFAHLDSFHSISTYGAWNEIEQSLDSFFEVIEYGDTQSEEEGIALTHVIYEEVSLFFL